METRFLAPLTVDFFIYEHFRNIQPHANAVPCHIISHFLEINSTFDSCCHVGNLANLIESEGLLREDEWPPRRRSWRSRSSLEDLELLVLLFFKFRNMEIRSIFSSTGNSRHNSSPTLGSISYNFQEININIGIGTKQENEDKMWKYIMKMKIKHITANTGEWKLERF